ncbi:MAG: GNAT family N-acetyltransferase [Duncaniella sp.]|nr:GNAT family N-acetyltransferase [Duncaniella sp.]
MSEWIIQRYTPALEKEWNEFNGRARNATFLTDRGYMDYHADRFNDHSLVARKNGKIMALLPADITNDGVLHSHRGLTYGGWILPPRHFDAASMLDLWDAMIDYCKEAGINGIDYKPLPYIYSSAPAGEDIYALFRSGARLTECNISAAIRLTANPGFNQGRRQRLRKAMAAGVTVEKAVDENDWKEFYRMLQRCLEERHDARPVHSLAELLLLKSRFPAEIELWVVRYNDAIQAATILYISGKVVHSQYIATTPEGRNMSLISPLFDRLISMAEAGEFGRDVDYFDFGTSNEDHGLYLNDTLYEQKASMGASGVPYERYLLSI